MAKDVLKEYTNGTITVVWKPGKCIHAKNCVNMLPEVYDPQARPWINVANASSEELEAQIKTCPSGALTYYWNDGTKASATEDPATAEETKVEVIENGPLMVYGALTVKGIDGASSTKNNATAFCRCGQSNNKPYCDGTHAKIDFVG